MSSFDPAFLRRLKTDPHEQRSLQLLAACRGRQRFYLESEAPALQSLRLSAQVESTESSNRLEGIVTSRERFKGLLAKKMKPESRDEAQIAGYRDALALVHGPKTRPQADEAGLLRLHRLLSAGEPDAGRYKQKDNVIVERGPDGEPRIRFKPVPAKQTPGAMRHWALHHALARQEGLDPVLAMALLTLDLTCIHPFRDGNGRVSRLWTLLLAYDHGIEVGRYISLERIVEQNKERYYANLKASSQGWHQHAHDPHPWVSFFLYVLLSAYQEFEAKAQGLRAKRGDKSQLLRNSILSQKGAFRLAQIAEQNPALSAELVRRVLRELRAKGTVRLLGRGRDAKYMVNP